MATQTITQPRTVESTINYFPSDGPKKIYPGTAGYQRRKFDPRTVSITDIRGAEEHFKLETNGFQVVRNKWPETKVDATDQQVKDVVYPETRRLLKQLYVVSAALPCIQVFDTRADSSKHRCNRCRCILAPNSMPLCSASQGHGGWIGRWGGSQSCGSNTICALRQQQGRIAAGSQRKPFTFRI
jgi:hypothetical protein